MKRDIVVIRESIGRIVNMLTNRAVKVTQHGSRAFVAYHPVTGKILRVNIPYLPDDASDEFVNAVQGFLDHEVGHVLHSDAAVLTAARKLPARLKNIHNIIEDVYIERRMTETFRGSGFNLEAVRHFYLERIARPKIDAALAAGRKDEARGYLTVIAARAWGGQTMAIDFMKNPAYAEAAKPIADRLGDELIEALRKVKSTQECLDLAKKWFAALSAKPKVAPPKPEPAPAPPPEPDEGDDDESSAPLPSATPGDEDDTPSKGAEDVDADKGDPADDPGTVSAEEDEGDDDDHAPSTPETTPPEDGDGAGEPPRDMASVPDTSSMEFPPETPDGDGGEGDDADDADDDLDGELDLPPEEGDELSGVGTEAGSEVGEEGAPGSTSESGTGGDDGKPAPSGDDTSDDEDFTPGDDAPLVDGSATDTEPDMSSAFDDEHDFDKDMGDELSREGRKVIHAAEYAIFSTDWDTIEPAPLATNPLSAERMVDAARQSIGVMQKQLERAMAAKEKKGWNPGQRRGRISPGALFRTSVGDDRVFRRRFEVKARNTVCSFLVDCSGSMYGGKIEIAGRAAYALSSTLERLKIRHEVLGFTTRDSGPLVSAMRAEGDYLRYARNEALYMPIFKDFGESLGTNAIRRLAHLTEHPRWLNENVDGECVQIAAHRLLTQRAERHILMVLSDGSPACPPGAGLFEHLRKVVKQVENAGVETIGIGIQSSAVKSFYPKNVVLNDIADLPTTVVAQLTKLLLD